MCFMKRVISLIVSTILIFSVSTAFAFNFPSHSSNDSDIAKKGDSGIYAYVSKGRNYDIYYIINFDDGYVYKFLEGDGNDFCDKVKIESGTLNDVVIITYHDDDMEWSYGLHFNWVRQPDHLIVQDNDGFKDDFYTTDLNEALELMENKEIKEY